MAIKIKQLTSVIALLAICLGVFPVAASVRENQIPNLDIFAAEPVKIIVSEASPAGLLISHNNSAQSSAAFSCAEGAASLQTLVQTQAAVNLNQPADCFSLIVAKNYRMQSSLSVQPLLRSVQRVVVLPQARISATYYNNAPIFPSQVPAIPASVMLMFFSSLVLGVAVSQFRKVYIYRIKQTLTLRQLRVMRC